MDRRDALVELVKKGWAIDYGPPLTICDPFGQSLENPTEQELIQLDGGSTVADLKSLVGRRKHFAPST